MSIRRKLVISMAAVLAATAILIPAVLTYGKTGVDLKSYTPISAYEKGARFTSDNRQAGPEGSLLVAQNDAISLYIHPKTAGIFVQTRNNETVWRSNPAGIDTLDVSAGEKDFLRSQFSSLHFNKENAAVTSYSYIDSVKKEQVELESIKDGVRVIYTLGQKTLPIDKLPKFITQERLDSFLGKLDALEANKVKRRYFQSTELPGFMQLSPTVETLPITIDELIESFEKAGYTQEDLRKDNELSGRSDSERSLLVIPLEYRLTSDGFSANIPTAQIQESGGVSVSEINLLKFFSAADEEENGYIFVPNASGSLIDYNNGKTSDSPYLQPIYGTDPIIQSNTRTQLTNPGILPVFGMKTGDKAWFAIIEEGDSIASVAADISGRTNPYNICYPKFTLRTKDTIYVSGSGSGKAELPVLESDRYRGNIRVNYTFLYGENADYSGMARYYKSYLEEKCGYQRMEESEQLPFFVDVIGSVAVDTHTLGVKHGKDLSMTTFDQAAEIADELAAAGVNGIRMRYLGWHNQGYLHSGSTSINIRGNLGGKSSFQALDERISNIGGVFFPDVTVQKPAEGKPNFLNSHEIARQIDGWAAVMAPYNSATLRMFSDSERTMFSLVSPAFLRERVNRLMKNYSAFHLSGISLRDMTDTVYSDKKKSAHINRETSKTIIIEQLKTIKGEKLSVMGVGGNAYALPYVDALVDVPINDNPFGIVDEQVPFLQMVLHGYVDYAGTAINLSDEFDKQDIILSLIETGTAPRYTWSYEDGKKLANTPYNFLYSSKYTNWIKQAEEIYATVNRAIGHCQSMGITRHVIHSKTLRETVFEDGTRAIVNYGDKAAEIKGIQIPAKDYFISK